MTAANSPKMPDDKLFDSQAVVCLAGKNDIAVECLDHLIGLGLGDRLCVVITQGDDGRSTWQRSLAFHARQRGVAVRSLDEVKPIRELRFFSVEFDRILRPSDFASRHLYNVHFSKLPAYRGVATAVWPILRGERQSGVTFHRIDDGVDTGPIIHQRVFAIGEDWTARDLYFRCLSEGAELFRESLRLLSSGRAVEVAQDEREASLFRRRDLDYHSLRVDLSRPAREVLAQLRAYAFWEYQLPVLAGRKVWSARRLSGAPSSRAGSIADVDKWRSVLSLADADLMIYFSPYDELYAWASGASDTGPDLSCVPDLNLQDPQGWSALMKAAHAGLASVMRALVAAGADVGAANRRGTTPLMYAFSRMLATGDAAAFGALLELGADPAARDQHGRSVRDYVPRGQLSSLQSSYPGVFQ